MRKLAILLACTLGLTTMAAAVDLPQQPTASAVYWVQNSLEYKACCLQTYRLATQEIRWLSALDPGPWAVVLDVDETVLSNVSFQWELAKSGRTYNFKSWTRWCERREATPIPGAKAFLEEVVRLGGKVALVTNRRENVREATEENLLALGIPFHTLLMKGSERDATGDKTERRARVASGEAFGEDRPHRIMLLVGDQIGDFLPRDLENPEEELDQFGKRFIQMPNPMYGHWLY